MHYQVKRGEQLYGPYTLPEIERYLASENILPTDVAKSEEMPAWLPVPELLQLHQKAAEPVAGFSLDSVLYGTPAKERTFQYPWFPVSPLKFVVMSLCTFGLYHVYWTYQNWNRESARTREDMLIWARAIFLGIFNFSLFPRIRTYAQEKTSVGWSPVFLAVCVLVFAGISRLPEPFALISLLSFVPYLPVVMTIQKVNQGMSEDVEESLNTSFSGANIAGIVFGGLLLLLAMVGAFMAQPAPRAF